jgi:uncharacterized membrane protein YqhA
MLYRFLAACRYLLVIPVVGCVLVTLVVVVMGAGRIVTATVRAIQAGDVSAKAAKAASLAVIEIIDLFLIGTVAYITAVGLYKLFIGPAGLKLPMRLSIESVKDLEDKIIGVIVAALAVAFLGHAAGGDEATELLNYGGGIALVIAALAVFTSLGGRKGDADRAKVAPPDRPRE